MKEAANERRPAYLDYPGNTDAARQNVTDSFVLDCAEEIDELLGRFKHFRGNRRAVVSYNASNYYQMLGLLMQRGGISLDDLARRLDMSMLGLSLSERTERMHAVIHTARQVSPADVRGRASRFSARPILYQLWSTIRRRPLKPIVFSLSSNGFAEVIDAQRLARKRESGSNLVSEFAVRVEMAVATQRMMEYYWPVEFRHGSEGGLVLPVTPSIALRLFKHRENEGRTRKRSLSHLVSGHWRDLPNLQEFQTFVREHRRGAESFTWFDFTCSIRPGVRDLDRLDAAIREREHMRETGADLRLRPVNA